MDYQLAKQLKNAGFPLNAYSKWAANMDGPSPEFIEPTLSKLIEAFGKRFHSLAQDDKQWWAAKWLEPFADTFPVRVAGDTPEEAVARLWLALKAGQLK
jgi:hypothetical protein